MLKNKNIFAFMEEFHLRNFTTNLIMNIQNLSLQSSFAITLYHPKENPTVGQISQKVVQYILCFLLTYYEIHNTIYST